MRTGEKFFNLCEKLEIGKWEFNFLKREFILTFEEVHKLDDLKIIFNGENGAFVLGNSHNYGGIHLIQLDVDRKIVKYERTSIGERITFKETVKKRELKLYLERGWIIKKKIIPIITPISKWWNKYSVENKINIISFLIPALIAIFFGYLNYQSNNEIRDLKNLNNELNLNNNLLNTENSYLIDSVNKLNKIIDTISLKPK